MAVTAAKIPEAASTDLIVFEKLTPVAVFAPGGVQDILDKIAHEVRSQHTDISTKAGREAVASLAYKVARSKTALDKMGKELGETHYKSWKAITSERARIETELDALRDEVRKPLTDYENAEQQRLTDHENALELIVALAVDLPDSSQDIQQRINRLVEISAPHFRDWQEFKRRADEGIEASHATLTRAMSAAKKREDEAAELARLRAEQIAREQKERDDRIAAEAAERARVEAEVKARREAEEIAAKAEVERKRVEQERAEAIARADKAEADRKAAAAKAEQAAKDAAEAAERNRLAAIENERKRAADEQAAIAAETAKREADKKHRAKINNEALSAIVALGVEAELGKAVIAAIARGEIPHTKMVY